MTTPRSSRSRCAGAAGRPGAAQEPASAAVWLRARLRRLLPYPEGRAARRCRLLHLATASGSAEGRRGQQAAETCQ